MVIQDNNKAKIYFLALPMFAYRDKIHRETIILFDSVIQHLLLWCKVKPTTVKVLSVRFIYKTTQLIFYWALLYQAS